MGEICISSNSTGVSYFGLSGKTSQTFKVHPYDPDKQRTLPEVYVHTGLLGFLGPNGLVFVTGTTQGVMAIQGRSHSVEDVKATVSDR